MRELTLTNILAECEEYGECLLWKGVMSCGSPVVYHKGKYKQCRRLVYEATADEKIPQGYLATVCCEEPRCLNFFHLRLRTHKQIGRANAKAGKYSTPQRRMAIALGRRRSKTAKLDEAKVREIRASTDPCSVEAKKHGINKSMVARIRRGQAWVTAAPNSSVFYMAA